MRIRARERQDKRRRNSRPILVGLIAALLQSFKGQHGEKMICVRGVPRVAGTLKRTNSHFDFTQT